MRNLFLTCLFAILFSCSNENDLNQSIIKNEGFLTVDLKNSKSYLGKNQTENSDEVYTVKATQTFELSETHPIFSTVEETKEYINTNLNSISGTYKFYINDILTYECIVLDGTIIQENNSLNLSNKKYPCTYKGIETCANDRIAAMNWFEKWFCITEGLGCVLFQMASCTVDNCSKTQSITQ